MLRCGDWRRAGRRVVAGKRPAGRRQAVADAWRYSRAAEGSESRLQAAMCSALAKDLGCHPGLSRQWGPRRRRAWSAAGRLLIVACAHAREQLQVAGLQIELVDVAAAPCAERADELVGV